MAGSFIWSEAIAAGATFDPFVNWQWRRAPYGGAIRILHRATLVSMVVTITSGSDTLVQESPVPAGGTAGVTPSEFDVPAIVDEVAAGDLIRVFYRNDNAGANTVDGYIEFK